MPTRSQHIAVIGAGVAGLAAARRLSAAGARVTVLERGPAVGGRVATAETEGCHYELGAEFLASFYTRTLAIIHELGLGRDLRRIPSSAAILRGGRLHSLWASARVALTPLVGPRDKLALSYLLGSLVRHGPLLDVRAFHRAHPIDDMAVSDYARAHLSDDLLEYVLQPALSGIFYWTPERTSRALLLLVLRAGLSRASGLQLYTMRQGLGQLPRAMAAGLDVRLCAETLAVEPDGPGYRVRARIAGAAAELACDGVVCATTASAVPRLMPWLDQARRDFFTAVGYSTTAQLAVGSRRRLPRGFYGLLFPRQETALLASATLQTVKDSQAAPRGRDVLCLHMAGSAAAALRECDDAMLAAAMLGELRRLAPRYDPSAHLTFQRVTRCPEALPEFDVGHFRRLQRFARGEVERAGLAFAGDYIGGPFVEGAILSGEQAADRLLARPHQGA
jgi:oxygen-dependent protoporphyrinogen oxidase